MTLAHVLTELKALADPRHVQIRQRAGVRPQGPFYGVSLTHLKALAKEIKRDHALAVQLWETGIHDARLLATYVEEPRMVLQEQLARQVTEIDSPDLAAKFVTNVVVKASFCEACASQWTQSPDEYVKQCGFLLIAELAKAKNKLLDMYFSFYLEQIAREAQQERNWAREAMNYALIAIGSRNAQLRSRALATADRTGALHVDYGDSACVSPDAAAVLRKTMPAS